MKSFEPEESLPIAIIPARPPQLVVEIAMFLELKRGTGIAKQGYNRDTEKYMDVTTDIK